MSFRSAMVSPMNPYPRHLLLVLIMAGTGCMLVITAFLTLAIINYVDAVSSASNQHVVNNFRKASYGLLVCSLFLFLLLLLIVIRDKVQRRSMVRDPSLLWRHAMLRLIEEANLGEHNTCVTSSSTWPSTATSLSSSPSSTLPSPPCYNSACEVDASYPPPSYEVAVGQTSTNSVDELSTPSVTQGS